MVGEGGKHLFSFILRRWGSDVVTKMDLKTYLVTRACLLMRRRRWLAGRIGITALAG
jgi:hypothetical protein